MYRRILALVLAISIALSLAPMMESVALAQITIPVTGATTVVVTPSNFTSIFKVANGVAYLAVGNESSSTPLVLVFEPGTYDFSMLNVNTVVLNGTAGVATIELRNGAILELGSVKVVAPPGGMDIAGGSAIASTGIRGGEISTSAVALSNVSIYGTVLNVSGSKASYLGMDEVYGDFRVVLYPAQYVVVYANNSVTSASITVERGSVVPALMVIILNSRIGSFAIEATINASTSLIGLLNVFANELYLKGTGEKTYINSSTIDRLYIVDGKAVLSNDFVRYLYAEGSNVTLAFSTVNMMRAVNSYVTTYASMIKMVSKMNCHCIEKQVMARLICVEWMGHRWCVRGNVTVPPVMHPIFRVINATHAQVCINATYCITVPIYALNASKMFMSTELGNQSLALPMVCKKLRHLMGMVIANSNVTSIVEKVMGIKMIVNMTLETPGNVSLVLPANVTVRAVYKNGTLWHNYTVEIKGNATIVNIGDPTNVSVVLENTTVTNTTTPTNTTTTPVTTPASKPMISTETAAVIVGVLAIAVIGATLLALRRKSALARY